MSRWSIALAALAAPWSAVATVATDLCSASANPCIVNAAIAIDPGSTLDFGTRALQLGGLAQLDVGGGALVIQAGSLTMLPGADILGRGTTNGGNITIQVTGAIDLQANGPTQARIDVSSPGENGVITINAGGDVTLSGELQAIGSDTFASGGSIDIVSGGAFVQMPSGLLFVPGGSQGGGGEVSIEAQTIDLQNTVEASGGDFGGGDVFLTTHGGDVTFRQKINIPGGGFSGDGGSLTIDSAGSVNVFGTVYGHAAGDSEDGAGSGGDVDVRAQQAIVVTAPLALNAAPPDGEGGTVTFDAGTTIQISNTIDGSADGADACGGSIVMTSGAATSLNKIVLYGGSCGGGDVLATALGDLTSPQPITVDGATGGPGGTVTLTGRNVSVSQTIRGVSDSSDGGVIQLQGCNVTLVAAAELRTVGGLGGGNTILASGLATINGDLLASTGATPGTNKVVYRNASLPPVFGGTAQSIPPAVLAIDSTLPPCPASGAVCGDGTLDPGEQCDDGNNVACDGCSASCRTEGCGNGRVECGEQCDNGTANGTPGNACATDCTIIPTPGGVQLIPGGRTSAACQVEWKIQNPGGETVNGFPSTSQSCFDGDPSCDMDLANDGKCVFDVAECIAANDSRIPTCHPSGVQFVKLQRPDLLSTTDPLDLANGGLIRDALASTGVLVRDGQTVLVPGGPVLGRDICTPSAGITVPHAPGLVGSRSFQVASRDIAGTRMRGNFVSLVCKPNPAVCGNGVTEIGEQCDDGNDVACDGCDAHCRIEACGNGRVECGEECDDGAANGTDASECTATCIQKVAPLRIPGGGSKLADCLVEYAFEMATPTLDRTGLPSKRQDCVDNDPGCDMDPTPGTCTFRGWVCAGGADARIGCSAQTVATLEVVKPTVRDVGSLAAVRQVLLTDATTLALPTTGNEVCTRRYDVTVATGRRPLTIGFKARDPLGKSDRDTLKLRCLPQPTP